jgi:hypothetical protein
MDMNYAGMDQDIKDVLAPGKYALRIANVDPAYVSAQKGTPGLKLEVVVVDGPPQDENGATAVGMHKFPILWFPNDNQTANGQRMCAKKLNDLVDACGFKEQRMAKTLQWEDLIGAVFVATDKPQSDDFGDKDEFSRFEPYQG